MWAIGAHPFFLLLHIFSLPYRRKGSLPLQDTIQYLFHFLLPYPHFLQPATHLPRSHHPYSPMFLPYPPRLLPHLVWNFWAKSQLLLFATSSHDFEELPFIPIVTHFPQASNLPPPAYAIGPDAVDLEDLRRVVSTAHPDHGIFVYFPGIPLPYSIPVNFFYSFFPLSSATLHELWSLLSSISTDTAKHTHTHNTTCKILFTEFM